MKSQEEKILAYLKSGKRLTQLDAYKKFNCTRLAARICTLRKDHPIEAEKIKTPTDKYVARYFYKSV
jgi:hypothetical protein